MKALEWAVSVWDTADNSLRSHVLELALSLLQIYRQTDSPKFHDMLGCCAPNVCHRHLPLTVNYVMNRQYGISSIMTLPSAANVLMPGR